MEHNLKMLLMLQFLLSDKFEITLPQALGLLSKFITRNELKYKVIVTSLKVENLDIPISYFLLDQ